MRKNDVLRIVAVMVFSVLSISALSQYSLACCDQCDCDYSTCDECDEGFTDNYRCVDNEKQRLWQYSDCTREWRKVDSCPYGCSDGGCMTEPQKTSVSASTPSDQVDEGLVHTTVKISNFNDDGDWYNIEVYLCEGDDYCGCDSYSSCNSCLYGCVEMKCDDNRVYVSGNDKEYVSCSVYVSEPGDYSVKVIYWSDDYRITRVSYSSSFEIDGDCDSDAGEYRCFGKYLQKSYVDDNCDLRWKIAEYCPYGCDNSECVAPEEIEASGEPQIYMPTSYEMDKCSVSSFTFTVKNKGESDSFDLDVSGEIKDWVDMPSSVSIDDGETKTVTAYVSVPCEASSGDYTFVVSGSSKTTDSVTAVVEIPDESGIFRMDSDYGFLLALLVFAVFVVAIFAYKQPLSLPFKKTNTEPEEFLDESSSSCI